MTRAKTAAPWRAAVLLSLTQMILCPLGAQPVDTNADLARFRGGPEKSTLLYQGPLVHDRQWVMRQGTTNTNLLGVLGGNCSLISSNVSNVRGFEQVRLETEYEGLGIWKVTHVDTVVGTAVAATGQRYTYTYNLRRSVIGITTDGRPPDPNRAMPTETNPGFLEPVPGNIEAATLEFNDFFLLREEATGRLVADANVIGVFHRRIDPSEQPPAFFPFVLDGYIATRLETVAGQAGCDPL
jgi:hypothetical protein